MNDNGNSACRTAGRIALNEVSIRSCFDIATFRNRETILSEFVPFPYFTDVFDRQKLTPIWSRFGLNNVLARFHHIPVILQPGQLEVISAVKADICRGEQAVEAVGTVRFRDCISLADANYGTRSDFGVRQFFPTKLCIAFGSAADFSARLTYLHGTFVYRIQRDVAHRGRQPAAACNSQM